MITVIDDFLSKSYFAFLQSYVNSYGFKWAYVNNITKPDNGEQDGLFGLSETLFKTESDGKIVPKDTDATKYTIPAILQIQDIVDMPHVYRARYDMTLRHPDGVKHDEHIDINHPDFVSVILYMNDSDGDTVIYNEKCLSVSDLQIDREYTIKKTITPKANRLVFFDGHYVHTGHSPSKHNNRILLNAVLLNDF